MSGPGSTPPKKSNNPLVMAIATSLVLLRTRRYRRNLLFGLTLFTLLVVFGGAFSLAAWLNDRPMLFASYWLACFLLVIVLLVLALYDLMMVRREHRREMRRLDQRLSDAMEDLRERAEIGGEGEAKSPPGDGRGDAKESDSGSTQADGKPS